MSVLQVDEIELEEDELEFKGDATVLGSTGPRDGTVELSFGMAMGTVDVVVNSETMFRDDEAMNHFDLTALRTVRRSRSKPDGQTTAQSLPHPCILRTTWVMK